MEQILLKCGPKFPSNEKEYLIEICSKDKDDKNQGVFFPSPSTVKKASGRNRRCSLVLFRIKRNHLLSMWLGKILSEWNDSGIAYCVDFGGMTIRMAVLKGFGVFTNCILRLR